MTTTTEAAPAWSPDCKAGHFDYKRAWYALPRLDWNSLAANVRDLVVTMCRRTRGLAWSQRPDCSLPWPEEVPDYLGEPLRPAFREIRAEELACAARVVNALGHWRPGGAELPIELQRVRADAVCPGWSWRFAHLADQELRGRLGLPERGPGDTERPTRSFEVHDGALRACYSSRNTWTWEEVGPATPETLERASRLGPAGLDHPADQPKALAEAMRKHMGPWWARWLAAGLYFKRPTDAEERAASVMAELRATLPAGVAFELLDVRKLWTEPGRHPFVIGPAHFPRQHDGLYLRPEAAPCAAPDCDRAHDDPIHRPTETLMVAVPQNEDLLAVLGLESWLGSVKDTAEALGVEAFAFPVKKNTPADGGRVSS